MGGGLINIASYGFNDLYLTGSPQITLFKFVYRRHTNFSKESVDININQMDFGEEITVSIPKMGDLFTNMYLQFEIPEIILKKNEIVDGLSQDENKFLMSPLEIPISQDEIEIINAYPIILDFIEINTAGYRTALINQKIRNQNIINYIDTILNSMTYAKQEDANYQAALNHAKIFEQNNDSKNLYIFDNTISDINYIIRKIKNKILDGNTEYTIDSILKIIKYAIDITVKVKKYYFDKIQKKHKMEQEASSQYAKFAWVKKLGYAMIDHVDINIGGERIDRHYGDWMNVWNELTTNIDQDSMYDEMLGNIKILTTFDRNTKPKYRITVPLNFWFCRKSGLAFPLIALQYSPVSLTIKLKTFEECAYLEDLPTVDNDGYELSFTKYSLSDIWDNMGMKLNVNLLIEYIYLDNLERKRFAQSAHEYLIETVEQTVVENIMDVEQTVNLEFFGPSKEIIWHLTKNEYNNNESNNIKYPFDYSLNIDGKKTNPFTSISLLLNGKERFFNNNFYDKMYYSIIQPMKHHTRIPSEGINMFSFGLFPEEHQPSSTCNFSSISNSTMTFGIDPEMFDYSLSDINPNIKYNSSDDAKLTTKLKLTIYSRRYNVIRFIGGMGALAYSYITNNNKE
jgi:hypothetical protein